MSNIDISKLDRSEVLASLYNHSRPQGVGFLLADNTPMQKEEAAILLKEQSYFDYLKGRVMKVDLRGNELDPRLYDRDLGQGAAKAALSKLKEKADD